jgi:hypothetical protein
MSIELDFGGYIPDFAIKQAFMDTGYQISIFKEVIPDFLEKYKDK